MRLRSGGWAWVGMAAGIIGYDAWAIRTDHPTMSQVFGEALDHPVRKWPVTIAWTLVTAHLFGRYIPQWLHRYDAISFLATQLPQSSRSRTPETPG